MNPKLKLKDRLLSEILDELDQNESIKLKPQAQDAVTSKSKPGDIHEKGAEAMARSEYDPRSGQKVAQDDDDDSAVDGIPEPDADDMNEDGMSKEDLKRLLQEYMSHK